MVLTRGFFPLEVAARVFSMPEVFSRYFFLPTVLARGLFPLSFAARGFSKPQAGCACPRLVPGREFPGAGSSLRSAAGLEDVLDESCGGDVEDEVVPELDEKSRDNNKHDIFRLAKTPLPLFGRMWLLTAGPPMGVSVFFAQCRRVLELLHCYEEIQIVNMYLCFLVCLHFTIGRYHGSPQSLHFVRAQNLFAQHVHRCSGVDYEFSFLWLF